MNFATRLAFFCACMVWLLAPATSLQAAPALNVVSSFSIISDLAQNVGADHIKLTTLVGADGDLHAYEPRPADVTAIEQADMILVNGLRLEAFLPRLIQASKSTAPMVELTSGIKPLLNAHDSHHGHELHDPHAWQSARQVKVYVTNIATAFCAADTIHCDDYQKNAEQYRQQLDRLDQHIHSLIEQLPDDKRTVITSHDAFGYFQREYGLKFLAAQGLATEAEASAADVAALIRQARSSRAAAIFVENITNPRLIRQIAKEAGVKVGGVLYSDALSAADGPAPTYIRLMEHNAQALQKAILQDETTSASKTAQKQASEVFHGRKNLLSR